MRYRTESLDVRNFLCSEIPLSRLSPSLRRHIDRALASGTELRELGSRAARELIEAGLLRVSAQLGEGATQVSLYAFPGSTRAYDLRMLLEGGHGFCAGTDEVVTASDEETTASSGKEAAEPDPTPTAAEEPPPIRSNAWASLEAVRALLRQDWVSSGLAPSLTGLLGQIRARLGDPTITLMIWQERLESPAIGGEGWELVSEGSPRGRSLLRGLRDSPARGLSSEGRLWITVWAEQKVVGALSGREDGDAALLSEAAGAVGDLLQAYRRSQRRVSTDALTDLYNRGSFDHQFTVEVERSRRSGLPLALLFIDLDHFKRVNDEYGHETGDLLLQHVARLFVSHLRRIDYVFRWGGEEFAVLLPATDRDEALYTAERLRSVVGATPCLLGDGHALAITVSVGVAIFPHNAAKGRELVQAADRALYRAKEEGRNRVQLFGA